MAVLQKGDTGEVVEKWQYFLNENGYSVGVIDGVFGINTETQTQDWQRDHGLVADGIVGAFTYERAREKGCAKIPYFE